MTGQRKFIMTTIALTFFTLIMALGKHLVDPLALGIGMGMLMAPTAAANAVEHMSKRPAQQK